jgi:hypothetical protein
MRMRSPKRYFPRENAKLPAGTTYANKAANKKVANKSFWLQYVYSYGEKEYIRIPSPFSVDKTNLLRQHVLGWSWILCNVCTGTVFHDAIPSYPHSGSLWKLLFLLLDMLLLDPKRISCCCCCCCCCYPASSSSPVHLCICASEHLNTYHNICIQHKRRSVKVIPSNTSTPSLRGYCNYHLSG